MTSNVMENSIPFFIFFNSSLAFKKKEGLPKHNVSFFVFLKLESKMTNMTPMKAMIKDNIFKLIDEIIQDSSTLFPSASLMHLLTR